MVILGDRLELWASVLICCSNKKGFRHLFIFTIKALTCTYVPPRLAHFTHSASIVENRKTQRSLGRGHGTSIMHLRMFFCVLMPNVKVNNFSFISGRFPG